MVSSLGMEVGPADPDKVVAGLHCVVVVLLVMLFCVGVISCDAAELEIRLLINFSQKDS